MSENLKVSVIVPVYNAAGCLRKCLDSLIAQTYKNIELILVNDGSKDESLSVCREYAEKFGNIVVIDQENSGPSSARNNGIEKSTGDMISFVDADDFVEPDMIERMAAAAEKEQADVVICNYYEESAGKSKKHEYRWKDSVYEGDAAKKIAVSLIDDVSAGRIPPYSWVRMIRRDVFEKSGLRYFPKMVRSEDYYLYVQLHFYVNKVVVLHDQWLYHYQEVVSSVTHSYVKGYWSSVKEIYTGLRRELPESREITNGLNVMFLQRTLIALNNSAKAPDGRAKQEIDEILCDELLKKSVRELPFSVGKAKIGMAYILFRLGLRPIIRIKYLRRVSEEK